LRHSGDAEFAKALLGARVSPMPAKPAFRIWRGQSSAASGLRAAGCGLRRTTVIAKLALDAGEKARRIVDKPRSAHT
jgi:hypothetical protein